MFLIALDIGYFVYKELSFFRINIVKFIALTKFLLKWKPYPPWSQTKLGKQQ